MKPWMAPRRATAKETPAGRVDAREREPFHSSPGRRALTAYYIE
jgi:hypothetical protein